MMLPYCGEPGSVHSLLNPLAGVPAVLNFLVDHAGLLFGKILDSQFLTAASYNLIDPLELFQNPWSSERWSKHVKREVIKYWTNLSQDSAASYSSLEMLDTSRLDLSKRLPNWTAYQSYSGFLATLECI